MESKQRERSRLKRRKKETGNWDSRVKLALRLIEFSEKEVDKHIKLIGAQTGNIRKEPELQNLYWDDNRNFIVVIKDKGLIKDTFKKTIEDFVFRCISPREAKIYCLKCGRKITYKFLNYEEYHDFSDAYDKANRAARRKTSFFSARKEEWRSITGGPSLSFVCKEHRLERIEREREREEEVDKLKQLYRTNHEKYFDTPHWQEVLEVLKKDRDYECEDKHRGIERCDGPLQGHHKTYDHVGEEQNYLEDLLYLCERHHSIRHGKEE